MTANSPAPTRKLPADVMISSSTADDSACPASRCATAASAVLTASEISSRKAMVMTTPKEKTRLRRKTLIWLRRGSGLTCQTLLSAPCSDANAVVAPKASTIRLSTVPTVAACVSVCERAMIVAT